MAIPSLRLPFSDKNESWQGRALISLFLQRDFLAKEKSTLSAWALRGIRRHLAGGDTVRKAARAIKEDTPAACALYVQDERYAAGFLGRAGAAPPLENNVA